ncbi:hypothetical protein [Flagellimonas okinawensis]|uniref:SGNH/GDSL hydrolase family protein n=1 Tax=Flagellimonas okinawensis TaxID=3031324 RepID=A0ABT5XR09_9FLAO|nr:hypothetical protein [[Muricauda] okinawensis]MDF0708324.1 hypothetical protein [[Muricauda] okinawensis]
MKKLVIKLGVYSFLILISLEILVRIFYLGEDKPSRFVDEKRVEKWVPNQEGYNVTGNRNQNFIRYNINSSGFNSYQEFEPTKDGVEIALVGDSFIEGFHQPYRISIGRKVEQKFNDKIKVFEYGYSGWDMADQLHLINAYKEDFDLIDRIYIKMKFYNDLERGEYFVQKSRLNLESPVNKLLKKSKLLIYFSEIGVLDPVRNLMKDATSLVKGGTQQAKPKKSSEDELEQEKIYLENFKNLVNLYGFDKEKTVLLMDESDTAKIFLDYLDENGFQHIDFGETINNSKRKTTLVYDMHWNNYGRTLIADIIIDNLENSGVVRNN